jgi:phosphate transport system substrate-binding protein
MRSSENLRKKIVLIAAAASFAFAGSGMVYAEDMTWEEKQNAAHKEELVKSLSEEKQRGDINGDGVINVFDVMRYKSGILEGNYFVPRDDDIDRDGSVNGNDITEVKKDILKKSKIWMYKTMPKMDGSTSAIPLEAGFKSKMLGLNYWDAKLLVEHHKTHESFSMLLSGENDLIFTVPISEEQYKAAETAGVKLNFVPVAKEGFVFVVNKNNPVDSLTSAQIRDIYSGKITNWKEVGGNDEKIIPYQRNKDSGSQNYMTEFMAGYDLMDPPKDFVRGEMSSLMDSIAIYDNAVNAIGYSVYSYAAQMYENSSDTKFIAVDGIKPSKETMADGTYPLLSSTSIVYTDKASQNTKDFADWAVSEEGQKCVMDSGYIPLKDMEYPENMKLYSAKGTGKEKPADYKPAEKFSHSSKSVHPEQKGSRDDKELYKEDCLIDFLKDKDFEKQINKDLDDIVFRGKDKLNDKWRMKVEVINGFMNITFYEYDFKKNDTTIFPDSIITLNYL